jgi:hypothetical protein
MEMKGPLGVADVDHLTPSMLTLGDAPFDKVDPNIATMCLSHNSRTEANGMPLAATYLLQMTSSPSTPFTLYCSGPERFMWQHNTPLHWTCTQLPQACITAAATSPHRVHGQRTQQQHHAQTPGEVPVYVTPPLHLHDQCHNRTCSRMRRTTGMTLTNFTWG